MFLASCRSEPAKSTVTPPPYDTGYCARSFGAGIGHEYELDQPLPEIETHPWGVEVEINNNYPFKLAIVGTNRASLWIEEIVVSLPDGTEYIVGQQGNLEPVAFINPPEGGGLVCINPPPDIDLNLAGSTITISWGLSKPGPYNVIVYGADNLSHRQHSYHPILD